MDTQSCAWPGVQVRALLMVSDLGWPPLAAPASDHFWGKPDSSPHHQDQDGSRRPERNWI
jgi:hypothetical protein